MTETPSNQQPCPLCLGNPNTYYENEGRVCTICQGVGRVPAPEFGTLAEHGRIVEADMTPNKKLTTPAPDIDTTIKSLKDNGLPEMAALAEDLKKIEAAPEPNQIYSVPTAFVDTPAPSEQRKITDATEYQAAQKELERLEPEKEKRWKAYDEIYDRMIALEEAMERYDEEQAAADE